MRAEVLSEPSIQSSRLYVMEEVKTSANSLLQSLAAGDMSVLDHLYDAHRDDFLRWAGHRFVVKNRDDLLDAWHDTMIMFYEQVRDKKLTNLTCEIKTFLFLIGQRRLLKMFARSGKLELIDEFDANMNMDESINVLEEEETKEEQMRVLTDAVNQLPGKTRDILIKRFREGKNIPQIMNEMGYESENAVSVTLSRGLKRLKELVTQRMSTD